MFLDNTIDTQKCSENSRMLLSNLWCSQSIEKISSTRILVLFFLVFHLILADTKAYEKKIYQSLLTGSTLIKVDSGAAARVLTIIIKNFHSHGSAI